MMKRLSSAVELKWWSGAPADDTEEEEEEDLQQSAKTKRMSRASQNIIQRNHDIPENVANGDIQLR